MAFRNDIVIRWDLSPRLIVILAPSTELIIQDLHDTLKEHEARMENMIYDEIIITTGGQPLGSGGVTVGLTSELQNACVSFESRTQSVTDGYASAIDITETILTDSSATFESDGVTRGATLINFYDFSVATVVNVISETQLEIETLDDGITNVWTIPTDYYKIWNNIAATITGGNLVAVDEFGASINPVCPTAFVQISRTTASSATSIFSLDIEYASFTSAGAGVSVDQNNISGRAATGTNFPAGTARQPCLNFEDALLIAAERGFFNLYILGDATIDNGQDFRGFSFFGESVSRTNCVVTSDALVEGCLFSDMTFSGTLDGYSTVKNCELLDIDFFNGNIINSGLRGTVMLAGNSSCELNNCHDALPGYELPTINMGGSGQSLNVVNWTGSIKITNKTGPEAVTIDVDPGRVVLTDTVTNGNFIVRGVGSLEDSSGGTAVIDSISLIEGIKIQRLAYDGHIHFNSIAGESGSVVGINGLPTLPSDNLDDVVAIGNALNLNSISVVGRLVLNQNLTAWKFEASGRAALIFDGYETPGASFVGLSLQGEIGTTTTLSVLNNYRGFNCTLTNSLKNLSGTFTNSILLGTISCHTTTPLLLDGLRTDEKTYLSSTFEIPPIPSGPPTIDVNGGNLTIQGLDGYLVITNVNDIDSYAVISMNAADVYIAPSCTNGDIIIRGTGNVIDASAGSVVNTTGQVVVNKIATDVFNRLFPFTYGANK